MALYGIGDLHLSLGEKDKQMDVFGGRWIDYMEKLRAGLSVLQPEDTIVLAGDLSWALSLKTAVTDFRFVSDIPGRKLLVKGNHDYWWPTVNQFKLFCENNQLTGIELLRNNSFLYNDIALCGTRGWFYEENTGTASDAKIFRRELIRLEMSLQSAGDREIYCFLHYPPKYGTYTCTEILDLLSKYPVKRCYYGHLHGQSCRSAFEGNYHGIEFHLISADYLNFRPLKIMD